MNHAPGVRPGLFDQILDNVEVSVSSCEVERFLFSDVLRVCCVCSLFFHEVLEHVEVALLGGGVNGKEAANTLGGDVGAVFGEELDHVQVAVTEEKGRLIN
jgi:hypothetical protein